ncbi:MAG: hypothetical protein H6613_09060 [Ignavibacteriales bacterium]|nr:hypothetical protein [Ignavibacteriales bacterium]
MPCILNAQVKLVPTFKEVFGDLFTYENTRAIYFGLDDEIPENETNLYFTYF